MGTDSSAPNASPYRILLVEDEDSIRVALARWLAHTYQVKVAADGIAALQIATQPPAPDLILTDVRLPGLDGLSLVRRLKQIESLRRVPVIFLTGQSSSESVIAGIAAGARAYLHKPVDLELLDRKLRSALRPRWPGNG